MNLIDDEVATGRGSTQKWAGPFAGLMGAIPSDAPYLRPGPMHWIYQELGAGRS